jgi:hypothetical protein
MFFSWRFGTVGSFGISSFILILSFAFKFVCFYALVRYTKTRLKQKPMYLLPHLPSLLLFIVFIVVFCLYIWPGCGPTCTQREARNGYMGHLVDRCVPVLQYLIPR